MITNQNIEIPTVESLTREKKGLIEKLSNIDRELVKIENQKKSFLSKKKLPCIPDMWNFSHSWFRNGSYILN